MKLRDEVIKGFARGWQFTPLGGKRPKLKAWAKLPPCTLNECEAWATAGNVGLRTGSISGVVVLDLDAGSGRSPDDFPASVTARTGKGWHVYYAAPKGRVVRNQAGKIDHHIDVRGDGGQVVFPGSVHPETGAVYEWFEGRSPDEIGLAVFPSELTEQGIRDRNETIVAQVNRGVKIESVAAAAGVSTSFAESIIGKAASKPAAPADVPLAVSPPTPTEPSDQDRALVAAYVRRAVAAECDDVAQAGPGTRNATLNRAAFNLGQLVGGGYISEGEVVQALTNASDSIAGRGDTADEVRATIASGLGEGAKVPRLIRPRPMPKIPTPGDIQTIEPRPDDATGRGAGTPERFILVDGVHVFPDGTSQHVRTSQVDDAAIDAFNSPTLCRKDLVAGELMGGDGQDRRFIPLTIERVQRVIGDAARFRRWTIAKTGDNKGEAVATEVPVTPTIARRVADALRLDDRVRSLRAVLPYPAYGEGYALHAAGWNPGGIFYDQPKELADLEPDTDLARAREILEDAVVDFPFREAADRENFFGLLLTPLVRPAINSTTPLHLAIAPLARTGKSKLLTEVFGGVLLGHDLYAQSLPKTDEEIEKRIVSMLLRDKPIWFFDNINHFVDSPSLAMLLTSTRFQGRRLGQNELLELPAEQIIVGTGNNVSASSEIAKRIVPIRLQPKDAKPDERTNFRHSHAGRYIRANRRRILAALLGMVEAWKANGSPKSDKRLGGFDAWSEDVGGILENAGFNLWRTNVAAWRENSDTEGAELDALVVHWAERVGTMAITAAEVAQFAKSLEIFSRRTSVKSPATSFGTLLSQKTDTPVDRWIIRRSKTADGRAGYALEPLEKE